MKVSLPFHPTQPSRVQKRGKSGISQAPLGLGLDLWIATACENFDLIRSAYANVCQNHKTKIIRLEIKSHKNYMVETTKLEIRRWNRELGS